MLNFAAILTLMLTGFIQPSDSTGSCNHSPGRDVYSMGKSRVLLSSNRSYVEQMEPNGNRIVYIVKIEDDGKERVLSAFFEQHGTDNHAVIIQQNEQDLVRYIQEGESNRMWIMQSDSLGMGCNAEVEQRGSNNRATIIQRN